jgi:hypothetical protein
VVISSKALGAKITTAKNSAIIPTVLKKTFGLILSNQVIFLEGIFPPGFYIKRTDVLKSKKAFTIVKKDESRRTAIRFSTHYNLN